MVKLDISIKYKFVLNYELIHIFIIVLLYVCLIWNIGFVPYEDHPWATKYEYSNIVSIAFLYLLLKYFIDLYLILYLLVFSIIRFKQKSILFGNIVLILIIIVAKIIDHYIFNVLADWILN